MLVWVASLRIWDFICDQMVYICLKREYKVWQLAFQQFGLGNI